MKSFLCMDSVVLEEIINNVSLFFQAPQAALAQSVLAEVPNQLVSYFKTRGLEPPKSQAAAKS